MLEMQEMQVLSLGRKIPWKRKWQPIPLVLPGKSSKRDEPVDYIQFMGSQKSWSRLSDHAYSLNAGSNSKSKDMLE